MKTLFTVLAASVPADSGSAVAATVLITDWRTGFRRQMNELDSKANTRAIDSLLNYETVKYFGNEAFEVRAMTRASRRSPSAAADGRSTSSSTTPVSWARPTSRRSAASAATPSPPP